MKHQLDPIDDFDPRPPEFHGKFQSRLHDFLEKVKVKKGLGISDPLRCGVVLRNLVERVSAFIESLRLSDERIREIERSTREQHRSAVWFAAR